MPRWAPRLGGALVPAWPTLFWVCIADAVFLVFGSLAVGVLLNIDVASTFVHAFFLAGVAMPLATLAGLTHEADNPAGRFGRAHHAADARSRT